MYDYNTERPKIFTERGVQRLLEVRDNIEKICAAEGCVELGRVGTSWTDLAIIDYLCERGYILVTVGASTQSSLIRWRKRP